MSSAIIPLPQVDVNVCLATLDDVPFIDGLQKLHAKSVGFMRTSWIEAKIGAGQVLVARASRPCSSDSISEDAGETPVPREERVGYVMGVDRYFKRDDVGIIYQMNVVPDRQRQFIGVALLKAMFERAAWGCKLFCCWCAQDLVVANKFWEAMGFVPLAYRAGGEGRGQKSKVKGQKGPRACPERASASRRVHIFWQKRIHEGDATTPWWFPCATNAGAMNADRIVLPIPPGRHWSDELPTFLASSDESTKLEASGTKQIASSKPKALNKKPLPKGPLTTAAIGMRFVSTALGASPPVAAAPPAAEPAKPAEATRPKRSRKKIDPKLVAAARELRDRWLEHVNENALMGNGKYDVVRRRQLTATAMQRDFTQRLLPAA